VLEILYLSSDGLRIDHIGHGLGPRTTLSYDDSMLTKTAQKHNFTIYLETSGNANVYSRLLSVQWQRQYCSSGGGRDAGRLYESGYRKKTVLNWCSIFHWQKHRNKTARHCKTPMKSNIFSNGSYVWLFLPDFPQQRLLVETLYVSWIS